MYGDCSGSAWNDRLWRKKFVQMLGLFGLLAMALLFGGSCSQGIGQQSTSEAAGKPEVVQTQADPKALTAQLSNVTLSSSTVPEASPFFCYVEILTGNRPSIYGYQSPKGCVPSAEFRPGELVVWRFVVLDTARGKQLTDKEAQSVRIRLPDGTVLDAVYKQRGDGSISDAPWTWDVCWDIPLEYPIGALDYTVLVTTKDGRSGTWSPPSFIDPVRGFDSRPQIVP